MGGSMRDIFLPDKKNKQKKPNWIQMFLETGLAGPQILKFKKIPFSSPDYPYLFAGERGDEAGLEARQLVLTLTQVRDLRHVEAHHRLEKITKNSEMIRIDEH